MAGADRQTGGEILERTRQETRKPELYKVLLLNDDYTTMD
ncbi:MAG: ATP-dependent Clp protease adaptor ClpS, partial [Actinobacteria bacterium]|nr:ATP-dependent Clp protease adaptor ClpS [Actinomycetota bacterium]